MNAIVMKDFLNV